MDTAHMTYVMCKSKNMDLGEQKAQILKGLVSQVEGVGFVLGR